MLLKAYNLYSLQIEIVARIIPSEKWAMFCTPLSIFCLNHMLLSLFIQSLFHLHLSTIILNASYRNGGHSSGSHGYMESSSFVGIPWLQMQRTLALTSSLHRSLSGLALL